MTKEFKLSPPIMPNYLTVQMPPRPRQDGFSELPKIYVGDLSAEEAEEYAQLMKETFLEHWKNKVQQTK